jgi:hypothetical protein
MRVSKSLDIKKKVSITQEICLLSMEGFGVLLVV